MSAIFEAEFRDLEYKRGSEDRLAKASTCKLVLLAIADHANDDGEAYPGLKRLHIKTALSKQGLIDTIEALKFNGLLSVGDKLSRLNTNHYTINIRSLPAISRDLPDTVQPLDQSSHFTADGQATLPGAVKPLDHNHHLTIIKPPAEEAPKTIKRGDAVDGMIEMSQMPGIKSIIRKDAMESLIATRLGIQPTRRGWKDFLEFVDNRQQKDGQMLTTFLDWLTMQPKFDVSYWPPDKMRENWNRAFIETSNYTIIVESDGGFYG